MESHNGPPPPYTETDVFSNSARSPTNHNVIHDDDASVDASSSCSNIIYTPPETPRDSQHSFGGIGDDYHTTTSTQAYFDSRPALRQAPSHNLVVSFAINQNATFEDFPYPAWAADREMSEQDWQTFVNHILPYHPARTNSHIIDRKLRDESEAQSSETKRGIAEAQLDQLRSSSGASDEPHDLDATIREWNDGFFGPRGITVRRIPPPSASRTPVARDEAGEQSSPPSEPVPQPETQGEDRSGWNPFGFMDSRGIRIGPLRVDGDRVSFGDTFEADRHGVRWHGQTGNSFESNPRGMPWHSHTFPGSAEQAAFDDNQGHRFGRGFGENGRGRARGGQPRRGGRDHSSGSFSSTSSASSSDSVSSIGSLPDWDDLKDTQLSVTKQSIATWLAHPEQPVTKDMLKRARADIKAARKMSQEPGGPSSDATKQALRQEVKVLLEQFNLLKRQQHSSRRAMRKEKRAQRKAFRQERRARRNAERRERRSQGRRFRRGEHEDEQNTNQHGRGHSRDFTSMPGSFFTGFGAGPNPSIPPVPPPPPPPPPPMHPPGPAAFFGPGRSGGPGFFGGRGGPFARRGRGHRGGSGRGGFGWEQCVQQATQHAAETAAMSQAHASRAVAAATQHAAEATAMGQAHANRAMAAAMQRAAEAQEYANREAAAAMRYAVGAACGNNSGNNKSNNFASPSPSPQHKQQRTPNISKYETVDRLEAQIAAKAEALRSLREKTEQSRDSDGDRKTAAGAERAEAVRLEREMEAMNRDVERLRLEADEEFARQLEAEEARGL